MSMDQECETEFKKIRDEIENLKKEIENLKKGKMNEKEDLGDLFDASEVD
jgi:Skp family chaperone for outer membrane proteins